MNIKIIVKSNNLYCRLTSGRQIDLVKKIGITIPAEYWDKDTEKIKNSYRLKNKDAINSKLFLLKSKITDKYNIDSINGEVIDAEWLQIAINECFSNTQIKSAKVNKWKVYLLDFCKHWINNESSKSSEEAVKQYSVFTNLHLTNFLKQNNLLKIKIKDVSSKTIDDFIAFMLSDDYSIASVKRHATRFKFFLHRAENANLEVDKSFKEPIKIMQETQDVKEIYLNEKEIETIFNLDYSEDPVLDNIRDCFVIGLWTGLRVSDFNNNLNKNNIVDGFIEIKTKKTGSNVAIPLHKHIIEILEKRNGTLPTTTNDIRFNKVIKDICQDAKINEITRGLLFDPKAKRNKLGDFEKYKLVSSHICRRSFATNLFGKVPNYVIQAVGGWSTERMMLHYIKKTNKEQAQELKQYWETQN